MRSPLAPRPVPIIAAPPGPAAGGVAVDLALVLVSDVSTSVDATEFELQKSGYFAAFTDPAVIAAIGAGAAGAIAVAYVEFAGEGDAATVAPWTVLRDAAGARAFALRLRAAPRSFHGRTSISTGLRRAVAELALWGGASDLRRVIDVCGDGINNSGEPAASARDAAVAAGATVNGLATINRRPHWPWAAIREHVPGGLPDYYRREVAGGPASFVLVVDDRESFAESVRRKLLLEIASR
jgi:hypothetical protein